MQFKLKYADCENVTLICM